MAKRGFTLCTVLASASAVRGGAVVELVPSPSANAANPAGSYQPGETVTVVINLSQTGGDDHLVRLVQLDFNASSAALGLSAPSVTWEVTERHFVEHSAATPRPGIDSLAYFGIDPNNPDPADMGPNETFQLLLPGDGTVKVGEVSVTMPGVVGDYALDVMNATDADVNNGAKLAFGFGLEPGDPVTTWRAYTNDLAGGRATVTVVPVEAELLSSAPACNDTLSRHQNNVIRLTFDGDLTEPTLSGQVLIQEALDNGAFGIDDYFDLFTVTVENEGGGNPRILKIAETGGQLSNGRWYAVHNTGGWDGVAAFEVKFAVVYGDADDSGTTGALDVTDIWGNRGTGVPDDSRYDIDGNGSVGAFDVNDAWGFRNLPAPAEPAGHDCS